jgi:hypothetical protein
MDPMAWLESLAKRQGANTDELTTSADLDVPLPPEDAQVTGPGYTPGYDTGSSKKTDPAPEPAKPAAAANPFMPASGTAPAKANPFVKAEPPKPEPAKPSAEPIRFEPSKTAASKPAPEPVKAEPPPPAPSPAPVAPAAPAASVSSDDPFGGMDPMAWLESLAKRQGANTDELTTAANIDVPLPPEDAQVTGPGYTPGYDTGKKADPTPEPARSAPTQKIAPEPEPPAPTPEPVAAALVASVAPAAPAASSDDPFGGLDPMAWLESLAKRQGANTDELTTAANIDVPLPPEDAQVTGPGYTPGYDTGKKAEPAPEPAAKIEPPQPETIRFDTEPIIAETAEISGIEGLEEFFTTPETLEPIDWSAASPLGAFESLETIEGSAEPIASAEVASDDPFSGLDPMAWLEALAKRQGADPAELVTGGTAEVPPPPTSAIPQGPGYSDYMPHTAQPLSGEIETPTMSQAEAEKLLGLSPAGETVEANPLEEMDPIKWLESLAANEPASGPTSEELSIFTASTETSDIMEAETALDWLEQLARETGDLPPAPAVEPGDDWLANPTGEVAEPQKVMSSDSQAMLDWLTGEDTPEQGSSIDEPDTAILRTATPQDVLAPSDLPDWLQEDVGTPAGATNVLSDQIVEPPIPGELPDWLVASVETQPSGVLDIEKMLTETDAAGETVPPESQKFSTSEIEALVSPGAQADPWAEALDEEYERKLAGDVTIPDWYQEALERYGETSTEAMPAPVGAESVISPSEPPGWLEALTEEPETAEPVLAEGIPAWLLEANPDFAAPPAPETAEKVPVDDWTSEAAALPAELPEWLRPAEPPKPVVSVAPVQAAPPIQPAQPAPAPARPAAQGSQVDLPAALRAARELVGRGAHLDSLPHFESVINASYELESVVAELSKVVTAEPKSPRARRLLGDAYMRRGDLQKALDTYRSALDQL